MVTSRTAGAFSGGDSSTVNVTAWPATGSAGVAATVTGMPGAGSTWTTIDAAAAWPATSVAVTRTV